MNKFIHYTKKMYSKIYRISTHKALVLRGRPHTVLFSKVTLDENMHQIWARGGLGEGLDHMWSEYEQIPMSPFWEKLEKPLFY